MTDSFDILVVGGGIAGASVAARLSGKGRKIALLEMEASTSYHATGRSAALADPQYVPNGDVAALTVAAAEEFDKFPGVLEPKAAIHLYGEDSLGQFAQDIARSKAAGAIVKEMAPEDVALAFPYLKVTPEHCAAASIAPAGSAHAIDVNSLMRIYDQIFVLHGGKTFVSEALKSGVRQASGWTIETNRRTIRAEIIVNAAGAWADQVAMACGAQARGLQPLKRTTVVTPVTAGSAAVQALLRANGPFVFWEGASESLYVDFRPSAVALISPADEEPSEPQDVWADDLTVATVLDTFENRTELRAVGAARQIRAGAGLRTFAPDRRPVIGWDPAVQGFFWHAAFGGFGIEVSPAASAIAADLVMGGSHWTGMIERHDIRIENFDPARLAVPVAV